MAAAVSPSSSPRLPSPPPIAEDQVGPTSPGVSIFEDHGKLPGLNSIDTGASRRIRPGTKAEDMAEGPPLVELQEIDSAFQLTEHLKALHCARTHPPDSNEIRPVTSELARELAQPPPNTSREIWLYELGRFLIQKTNAIIVALFADSPPCSPQTCPEMRASEWQYLCAVHDPPKSCSAIDYCCHTLDWAATSLTSSKMFPSRLGLGSHGATGNSDKVLQQQMKEITNIFRRVYRIYAHAWFQHREMFWKVEGKTGLYIFFKTVCDEWNLIQQENYTIPPEAEGHAPSEDSNTDDLARPRPTSILPRPGEPGQEKAMDQESAGHHVQSLGGTSKRHVRGNSSMSGSVTTVIQEEAEEEEASKPSLGRATTVLHELDGRLQAETSEAASEQEQAGETAEEEATMSGISRSDTLRPSSSGSDHDAGNTTAVLAEEPTKTPEEPVESPGVEVQVTEIDPPTEETTAAAGDEAGKNAAD